jgi:hypothetical protein
VNIALIHSGVAGTVGCYADDALHHYRVERIGRLWRPCFADDDVVLVPNGANHLALFEARASLHEFVARGGALLCFCGFFMPWLPGLRWRHDYRHPLRDVSYHLVHDSLGLFDGVTAHELCVDEHGLRGGWACGEILDAPEHSVVLRDNFQRVLMVAEQRRHAGLVIATASGPLFDDQGGTAARGARRVYRNILRACRNHHEARNGS